MNVTVEPYEDEGKANTLLIQFFSSLLRIPFMDLSLSNEEDGFALHVDGLDYEEVYLRLEGPLSEPSNQ